MIVVDRNWLTQKRFNAVKLSNFGIDGYRAMQRTPNLEEIFPIRDASSAALMAIKADCLYRAGIITRREKRWVDSRVSGRILRWPSQSSKRS
jgi:hypothetical protein